MREFGLFALLIGVLFLSFGVIIMLMESGKRKNCTYGLVATVVDNVVCRDSNRIDNFRRTYAPVFWFEYNGRTYQVRSNVSTNVPRYKLGQQVSLKINPDDPYQVRELDNNLGVIVGASMLGVGVVGLVAGIALCV